MAVTSQIESERKYDVDEWTELPDLARIAKVEPEEPVMLRATYFDTADGALAAARMTLRRRTGGGDEGWHLKTPEGEDGRREHQAPLGDPSGLEPPGDLLEPVRELLGDRSLVEIARLHTERRVVKLIREGAPIAEVADDLVSATDVRTGILRVWREWECELLDGAPVENEERLGILDRIEGLLLSAGARPASAASKLARATGRSKLG
ncbi:CYTH domain-containing protein [Lysobacter korlensis]|uniref:CYTH domain-containing protein n=1 Tax=Lysobacter korlensis TaxID=553636 RepID=A0ABV6RY21_9GAMM